MGQIIDKTLHDLTVYIEEANSTLEAMQSEMQRLQRDRDEAVALREIIAEVTDDEGITTTPQIKVKITPTLTKQDTEQMVDQAWGMDDDRHLPPPGTRVRAVLTAMEEDVPMTIHQIMARMKVEDNKRNGDKIRDSIKTLVKNKRVKKNGTVPSPKGGPPLQRYTRIPILPEHRQQIVWP